MGYYRLKDSYVLRGWEKLPWALVLRPGNQVLFLSKEEFDALSICNGMCDCDVKIVPERTKELIRKAVEKDIVEPCGYGQELLPDQEYRQYQNRYIRTAHW